MSPRTAFFVPYGAPPVPTTRVWHGYAPYNPTMWTIFRALNNFVFVSDDGTPAMRLGIAQETLIARTSSGRVSPCASARARPGCARRRGNTTIAG